MPLTKEEFDAALDFNELKQKYAAKLELIASRLGLVQEKEVPTNGGRVDFVWYYVLKESVPQIGKRLPVVGFEMETSWRTRKHIKGDLFNLLELSPGLGVILFLREGFKAAKLELMMENLRWRGTAKIRMHVAICFACMYAVAITAHKNGRPELANSIAAFTY